MRKEHADHVWTDDEVTKLRRLWTEGHSMSKIGLEFSVTRNAIAGKVGRLHLPPRAARGRFANRTGSQRSR